MVPVIKWTEHDQINNVSKYVKMNKLVTKFTVVDKYDKFFPTSYKDPDKLNKR